MIGHDRVIFMRTHISVDETPKLLELVACRSRRSKHTNPFPSAFFADLHPVSYSFLFLSSKILC
jgi:hypothetical protein